MAAVLIEGIVLCFVLLLICVINIQNGPVGGVHYYEQPVKERVIELGLITAKEMQKNRRISGVFLMADLIILAPWMVFAVNGARTFWEGFIQLTAMYLVLAIFDRVFIDWYWVGHTRAWIIPGTEDLLPYIHRETWIKKIGLTAVLYPLLAALLSWLVTALL